MYQSGDIVHVHTKSLLGFFIRLFEKMRYGRFSWSNHTAIIFEEDGLFYIYEANPKVIRTEVNKWISDAKLNSKQFIVTRIPEHDFKIGKTLFDIKKDIDILIGDKYDYDDLIISMPISMITGLYFKSDDVNRFICSRFVAFLIDKYTYNTFNETNICPAKIYEMCANYEKIE